MSTIFQSVYSFVSSTNYSDFLSSTTFKEVQAVKKLYILKLTSLCVCGVMTVAGMGIGSVRLGRKEKYSAVVNTYNVRLQ